MVKNHQDLTRTDEQLAEIVASRGSSAEAMYAAHAALMELYRRHARRLLAFLGARVTRGDLDDMHQEVWLRVWRHLPGGFEGGCFRSWLYRIARNAWIDQRRRKQPEAFDGTEEDVADVRDLQPDKLLIEQERKTALEQCLEQLGSKDAEIIRSRLRGEDYSEICRRLELSPERAHRIYFDAKERLKTCLERALK